MQVQEQTHPDNSNIQLNKLRPNKNKIITNRSNITIKGSTIDLIIHGDGNEIKIEESAGKFHLVGSQNQVEINQSWISCELDGNNNIFHLVQAQFQLKRYQGAGNYIPRVLGQRPRRHDHHRQDVQPRVNRKNERWTQAYNQAHYRLLRFRQDSQLQNTKSIKKLCQSLVKSKYKSQNRQCPICYVDIKNEEEVTSLFCFHLFHSVCIEACLQTTTKCPVCSLDILRFIKQGVDTRNFVETNEEWLMKDSIEERKICRQR